MNFLLAIVLLLALAKLLGEIFERIRLPAILGELLAGLLIGILFAGKIVISSLEGLALLGVILLLFLIGFNFSVEKFRNYFKTGSLISLLGFVFVLVSSYFILKNVGLGLIHAVFFALIMGGESTPNTIKTIVDLKQLHSKVSEVIVSTTVIEDMYFYSILAFTVVMVGISTILDFGIGIGKIFLFFIIFLIMERITPFIIKYSERMRVEEAQFAIGFILIILLAYFANTLGFATTIGAFFAGIALAYSPYLKTGSFSPKMAALTYGVFAPLFFAWMGLQIKLSVFFSMSYIVFLLVLVGIVTKFIGNFLGSVAAGLNLKESTGVSLGLTTRGGEQLLILVIAAQMGVFGTFVDSILIPVTIIAMLITIFVSPVMLKIYFKYAEGVKL